VRASRAGERPGPAPSSAVALVVDPVARSRPSRPSTAGSRS
jgi:hypothetical protein